MTENEEDKNNFVAFILLFLLLGGLFELVIVGIAFFGADKVECNFIWCTFTTTRSESYSSSVSTQDCFMNGERINCTDMVQGIEYKIKLQREE